MKRQLLVGWIVLLGLILGSFYSTAWATMTCGTCQVCKHRERITIPADYCAVANNESGSLCCDLLDFGTGTVCGESGDACYGIIVGGGGGDGGTGGGTSCSYRNGWCPAECMSCSSGGKPAI
jgi:hypothetical protein